MDNEILETAGQGGGLNYPAIILMQTNRIAEKGSQPLSKEATADDAFKNSVIMLDALMEPYKDEIYNKRKEEIKKLDEPVNVISTRDEFILLLGALTALMSRCGLMPYEPGALYDEGQTLEEQ